MVPVKKDGKDYLRCTKCGYEMKMTKKERKEFQVKEQIKNNVLTTSTVSNLNERGLDEEQLQQEREEYYKEIGQDLLQREFEGEEEE
jgi:DNA-directed RNA polymerase subunit M